MEFPIMAVIFGAVAGVLMSAGFYFSKKYVPNTEINWTAVASYTIVGGALGAIEAYTGIVPTYELISLMLVANMGIIAALDTILSILLKPRAATFVIKYTGHTFYPEITLTQNTGEFQVFNTEITGRCLSVTAHMKPLAQAIRPMLATVMWSPGFMVTPCYTDGMSPLTQTFKFVTGRNPDLSAIKSLTVDWKDGSPIETVKLELNKEGNPEGNATHTFMFNGN
jgi:hypothetical protein